MSTSPTMTTSPLSCSTSSAPDTPVARTTHGASARLDVHGDLHRFEEVGDPFDAVPHEVAAHVVGVEMGGEDARAPHVVGGQDVEQSGDVVGGVDDDRLAVLAVADEVAEVHHLARHGVARWRSHVPRGAGGSTGGRRPWPDGRGRGGTVGERHAGPARPGRYSGGPGRHRRAAKGDDAASSVAGMFRANVGRMRRQAPCSGSRVTTVTWAEHQRERPAGWRDALRAEGVGPGEQGGVPRPQRPRVLRGPLRRGAERRRQRGRQLAPGPGRDGGGDRRLPGRGPRGPRRLRALPGRDGERAAVGAARWWCSATPRPTPTWAGPRTWPGGSATRTGWPDRPATDPGYEGAPDDVSMQLYTSGTTGLPKGVMLANAQRRGDAGAGRRATPSRSTRTP